MSCTCGKRHRTKDLYEKCQLLNNNNRSKRLPNPLNIITSQSPQDFLIFKGENANDSIKIYEKIMINHLTLII